MNNTKNFGTQAAHGRSNYNVMARVTLGGTVHAQGTKENDRTNLAQLRERATITRSIVAGLSRQAQNTNCLTPLARRTSAQRQFKRPLTRPSPAPPQKESQHVPLARQQSVWQSPAPSQKERRQVLLVVRLVRGDGRNKWARAADAWRPIVGPAVEAAGPWRDWRGEGKAKATAGARRGQR